MVPTAVQDQPGLPLHLSLLSPTWLPPSSLNYSPLRKFTMFHVLTHTVSLIHTYFSLNIHPKVLPVPPASIAWPPLFPLVLMCPWCPEYHICTSRNALSYAALQLLTCIVFFKAEKTLCSTLCSYHLSQCSQINAP